MISKYKSNVCSIKRTQRSKLRWNPFLFLGLEFTILDYIYLLSFTFVLLFSCTLSFHTRTPRFIGNWLKKTHLALPCGSTQTHHYYYILLVVVVKFDNYKCIWLEVYRRQQIFTITRRGGGGMSMKSTLKMLS